MHLAPARRRPAGLLASLLVGLVAVALHAAGTAAPLPKLRITPLDASQGFPADTHAVDINNAGQVLAYRPQGPHFFWQPGSAPVAINEPPGEFLSLAALNDQGLAVGNVTGSREAPITWTAAEGLQYVALDKGLRRPKPLAVSNQGRIVGWAVSRRGGEHMINGSVRRGLHDPRPDETRESEAHAINEAGTVGGSFSLTRRCCYIATLTDRQGRVTSLGSLAGAGEVTRSTVKGLNDQGQAVGSSNTASSTNLHAFIWSRASGMVDLGVSPRAIDWSVALDINQYGQVVGIHGDDEHTGTFAFYWDAEHGPMDLDTRLDPADPLTAVTRIADGSPRINDRGEIVTAAYVNGQLVGVLLTPTP